MGKGVSKTAKKIPTCFMEGPLLIQYDVGIQTKSFGFDFQYDCKFSLSLYSKLQNRTNFRMGYIQEGGLNISTNTMIFPESICILANRPLVTSLCMFDKVYLLLFKVNYPIKVI